MPNELATADADALLNEHAKKILAANEKLRGEFRDYITTVGESLKAAQDSLATKHAGFDKWAKEQFGWSKARVHQLLHAADVFAALSTTVDDRTSLPANERQCRVFARIERKHWAQVWREASEEAEADNRAVTAALILKHAPRGARAEVKPAAAADPDRLLGRLDAAVRQMVLCHPDRLADTVATLSSLIEFCRRPHVIAAMADPTPKASLDICPTIRADRTPLVLDHVPAESVAVAS